MRSPRDGRKGSGHQQNISPRLCQRAVQIGETDIIADRQADLRERRLRQDGPITGPEPCRFAEGFGSRHIHVEHVDLVIAGHDRTCRVDQE